jgi:Arm DNA-binding domain
MGTNLTTNCGDDDILVQKIRSRQRCKRMTALDCRSVNTGKITRLMVISHQNTGWKRLSRSDSHLFALVRTAQGWTGRLRASFPVFFAGWPSITRGKRNNNPDINHLDNADPATRCRSSKPRGRREVFRESTMRKSNKLTARQVAAAKPGRHGDGAGLYLVVAHSGARKWIMRFTWAGKPNEMGLGGAAVSLAQARGGCSS